MSPLSPCTCDACARHAGGVRVLDALGWCVAGALIACLFVAGVLA